MVGIGRTGDGGKNSSGSQDLGQNIETPRKVFGRYLWSFKGYRIYGVADAAEVYAYATRDRAMAETASVAASAAETCVFGAKLLEEKRQRSGVETMSVESELCQRSVHPI